ncbi:MAG: hypothetical protein OEV42_06740 [Deltaproteobacteria bacterium]|nr:hypothetical protein [Deltaproteobacteria bacterium]
MSKAAIKLKVSKPTAECIKPEAPKEMRMLAAEGRLPVEPKELLVALYFLTKDKDPHVSSEAEKSLLNIPLHILTATLQSEETHPRIIDHLSHLYADNNEILQVIIESPNVVRQTLEAIAESADEDLLAFISEKGSIISKYPSLFECIKKNPVISAPVLEKIGSILEEDGSSRESEEFPAELIKEKEEADDEEKEEGSLYAQILEMGVSQKIKLAITGNKEARGLLVKEPNRLICGNVMKNPRITESEVVLFSSSKSVGEEVFRAITANRDWMKNYQIKLNLVSNPRVPLPTAMNLLTHIRDKDLELLSKSRNVSKSIANMARRMVSAKKEKKK